VEVRSPVRIADEDEMISCVVEDCGESRPVGNLW
jgi:hypothetical protein